MAASFDVTEKNYVETVIAQSSIDGKAGIKATFWNNRLRMQLLICLILYLNFYDEKALQLKVIPGEYEIFYGNSSNAKDLKMRKITVM